MNGRVVYRLVFAAILIIFIIWGGIIIAANVNAAEPVSEKRYISITINTGDTLWNIAKEYCSSGNIDSYVEDLMLINGLKNDRNLIPGASLIVYSIDEIK